MKGKFNPEELSKLVAEEHNKFREDPQSYIIKLQAWLTKFRENTLYLLTEIHPLLTFEGTNGVYEAINYLREKSGTTKLELSPELSKAAMDHAKDIGENGLTSHEGSDGSDLTTRIERYIEWDGACAESIDFGFADPCNIICNLIVDDGVKEKYQREYLLSEEFKYIGVGMAEHRDLGYCCVIIYAKDLRKLGEQTKEKFDYIHNYILKTFYRKNPVNEFQEDDIDAPDNTVSKKEFCLEKTIGGETKRIRKKIYTLDDKTQHIVEVEEN